MFKRILVPATAMVSTSKSKKPKSPRSIFYSKLMKNLGGETGDNLANAFTKGESDKFRTLMQELCDKMEDVAAKQTSQSSDTKLVQGSDIAVS
jgi:hypothetical protein